ncbi:MULTISPECIES: cation:proton antiporter [Kosmotoga]|jgi:multicomponent Na+:H+ antiporter subunit F|uniref:Multiple resistance and pH regulation protein F n=1 Tax=Kosmotoga olearia (strain ATCC BAA-1733 / DSM 21960 / TBF 19.5.1) TaxID=521045 RepID=C5CHR4_KOSOT|nr:MULTISPECIES: cation:proton antiporter [Kosmotoga]ACR80740.1 multiple resistance and pH regulation protein F [Kosmotoga olearia TBF 19.5.1]MDK2954210.1 multicomponent Na+:H+ antiporter subunit [Kosmotoga sp.]OAA19186.1 cation:proton antiporter [Kosmotoga sp. DU53]
MILFIFLVLVALGFILALFRVFVGPTVPDRIVALDTLNVIVTGAIALFALIENNELFLDIALAYAILAFLETVVVARYLEGRK